MATPLSATQFLQIFRERGVSYETRKGWGKHTRTSAERPWGPVHGVMIHHTGDYRSEEQMLDILWSGHSGLPGPLSHGGITKDGTVHLTGYGRCNHAGRGDRRILDHVIAEDYTKLPAPRFANDSVDPSAVDGNRYFYGFELVNRGDGVDPWPLEQIQGAVAAAAAICAKHGWTERSVIGHLEWQRGKVDPLGFSMPSFRTSVRKQLRLWEAI